MRRGIAGALLLALTLPVVAQAQTSRVEGLALQGDYLKDYTGIFTYPSEISNVGNLIFGELGRSVTTTTVADRGVGTVLGNLWDGRFGTWGLHLRQFTPALGQGDVPSQPNPGGYGLDPNFNSNEAIDLMWGRKSGTTSFGLRFNRSFFKSEDALPGVITSILEYDAAEDTANLARNVMGIGAGVGFEMNPNTNIELTVLYQARSFEVSTTTPAAVTTLQDDGAGNYLVGGRALWQWQPNVLVIPVVRFYSFDLSTSSTVAGVTTVADNSLTGWQAGVAGNWTLGTNDLFVLGLTVAQNRLKQEDDIFGIAGGIVTPPGGTPITDDLEITETITPQLFAALETHVNNWLTFRLGASKGAWHSVEIQENATAGRNIKTNLSSFKMNIGTGVKIGTIQLDAVLNNAFPQTLGGFFSQTPTGFVSFPKVTATYSF
jgi:hypothetical protein